MEISPERKELASVSSRPVSVQSTPSVDWPSAERGVRDFIAHGKEKTALDRAKELHKARQTAESESLLIDAYVARVESLIRQSLITEADALISMVVERYPAATPRFEEHVITAAVRGGSLDKLLAPLADPNLNPERRAMLERIVEQHVTDLRLIADSPLLPEGHSLRESSRVLHMAFVGATSGPVSEEALAVQISHRSPLAPWKMLIRAISSFHAADDETCRRSLDAIKPGSAPSRLVPLLRHMLGDAASQLPSGPASELVRRVTGGRAALGDALKKLDESLQSKNRQRILDSVRAAAGECRISAPSIYERLKQYLAVRQPVLDLGLKITSAQMETALGSPVRVDAFFMRINALAFESTNEAHMAFAASMIWNEFRKAAVYEGWFRDRGPEAAALYLHIAGIIRSLPPDFVSETKAQGRDRRRLDDSFDPLDVDALYSQACALHPHSEAFIEWLSFAEAAPAFQFDRADAEQVARAWQKAVPGDIRPLLFLIAKKEAAGAYHTAIEILGQAEAIDSLHTDVRNARYRLTIGKACNQIKRKKGGEAEESLRSIAELAQAAEGDRPVVLTAMRCVLRVFHGDKAGAEALRIEAGRMIGDLSAALLLIDTLAGQCGLGKKSRATHHRVADRGTFAQGLARVGILLRELRLRVSVPHPFLDALRDILARSAAALTVEHLVALGDLVTYTYEPRLLYMISAAGLKLGDEFAAHFLLLRADALLNVDEFRSEICAGAALSIARERRDQKFVDRVAAFCEEALHIDLPEPQPGDAVGILAEERAAASFPRGSGDGPDYEGFREKPCDCPACRAARGERSGGDMDQDSDDIDRKQLERRLASNLPPGFPPEFAREIVDAMARGENPDEFFRRMSAQHDLPPFPAPGAPKRKKRGRRK
jgi:hypothetical protein